jgi:hypothetical protein
VPGERGAGTCRRSGWCCSFRGRLGPFLGTVTRLQVADLGHPQRPERPGSLRGDRLGGQADMVAALILAQCTYSEGALFPFAGQAGRVCLMAGLLVIW